MSLADPPPYTLVVSTSLDTESRSALLAHEAQTELERSGGTAYLLDLRDLQLPQFDNAAALDGETFRRTHALVEQADSIVMAIPIYNWGAGSSAKNFIELTGTTGENGRHAAWFDKVITFICAGGLPHSYMAYSQIASSMMLDFKCVVNPYMVYATDRDLSLEHGFSDSLRARLAKTIAVHAELRDLLAQRTYRSDWEI